MNKNNFTLVNIIRALRLPFVSVSILAFIFGSLIVRQNFNFINFLLGLVAVIATHLGANLINDYADSKSGVDWQDKNFYGFFGGSKLIQEGIFQEGLYLKSAIILFIISLIGIIILSINLKSIFCFISFLIILFMGWSYSHKPFYFSYHRLGELVIFILFGPAIVMGAYFIQTGIFPDLRSFVLSLPFGILTAAILFANEIPDYNDDIKSKKFNLVYLFGPNKSYIFYIILIASAFISIGVSVIFGFLNKFSLVSFILLVVVFKAVKILKYYYFNKINLINSSKLTILLHTLVSIILIISILL